MVLVLDVITKVLAVKLLTPGQPVSMIGDTVTWILDVRLAPGAYTVIFDGKWVSAGIGLVEIYNLR